MHNLNGSQPQDHYQKRAPFQVFGSGRIRRLGQVGGLSRTFRHALSALALIALVTPVAFAQGQGRGGPGRGGPGGKGGPGGMGQGGAGGLNAGGEQGQQACAMPEEGAGNSQSNNGMPSVQQLAQMLMANADADGSGSLDISELQTALTGLRNMMMQSQMQQNRQGGRQQAGMQRGGQQAMGMRPARGGSDAQNANTAANTRGGRNGAAGSQRGQRGR